MIRIRCISRDGVREFDAEEGISLQTLLRRNGYDIYSPCGGRGCCGKCTVWVSGVGKVISCRYKPAGDTEVILPGENEARILVRQTEFLEDFQFKPEISPGLSKSPIGVAIDLGTTTVVLYFLNLIDGAIEKIASFLNPQMRFGADVISRITYCQENETGIQELQNSISERINFETDSFLTGRGLGAFSIEKIIVAGNTTMLHLLLGEDPVPIALAPFTPKFTAKQIKKGGSSKISINPEGQLITLPCLSAYVGADIIAGLAVLKPLYLNYLFVDIGTNGEIALVTGSKVYACSAAAGPAFEGSSISCGMAAVTGAVSGFSDDGDIQVIGNAEPAGICGSGIVDIVAYLVRKGIVDETGFMKNSFVIHDANDIKVTRQDIREIQLAKSAIFSGIRIIMKRAGIGFGDIEALYLAGGFGNYINIRSAVDLGLLPEELENRIFAVGNSAGIGALQYLRSDEIETRISKLLENSIYVDLSEAEDFPEEFAMNMDFPKRSAKNPPEDFYI
ncbi:MAG: ASKHA domain-containing protein [Bacteroidales bacterium]